MASAKVETRGSFLSRPDLTFVGVWTIVLAMYLPVETPLSPALQPSVLLMLLGNMFGAVIISSALMRVGRMKVADGTSVPFKFEMPDGVAIDNFILLLGAVSMGLWVLNILYSGGLPLFWFFQGTGARYYDFGIPTLGGLMFMTRCFLATLLILRYSQTNDIKYLLGVLMFLLLYLSEVNRGGLFVFIAHCIAITFIYYRLSARTMLVIGGALVALFGTYLVLGSVRAISDASSSIVETGALGGQLGQFLGIWLYVVTPLGNINFAAQYPIEHNFTGFYTFMPVIPTVLREVIYGSAMAAENRYGLELASEAYNATSMYGPLILDFGFFGAFLVVTLLQVVSGYVYALARAGDDFYSLIYPPLFASVLLSPFYIYAASLVVLSYPLLCFWLKSYILRGRQARAANPSAPLLGKA